MCVRSSIVIKGLEPLCRVCVRSSIRLGAIVPNYSFKPPHTHPQMMSVRSHLEGKVGELQTHLGKTSEELRQMRDVNQQLNDQLSTQEAKLVTVCLFVCMCVCLFVCLLQAITSWKGLPNFLRSTCIM